MSQNLYCTDRQAAMTAEPETARRQRRYDFWRPRHGFGCLFAPGAPIAIAGLWQLLARIGKDSPSGALLVAVMIAVGSTYAFIYANRRGWMLDEADQSIRVVVMWVVIGCAIIFGVLCIAAVLEVAGIWIFSEHPKGLPFGDVFVGFLTHPLRSAALIAAGMVGGYVLVAVVEGVFSARRRDYEAWEKDRDKERE